MTVLAEMYGSFGCCVLSNELGETRTAANNITVNISLEVGRGNCLVQFKVTSQNKRIIVWWNVVQ